MQETLKEKEWEVLNEKQNKKHTVFVGIKSWVLIIISDIGILPGTISTQMFMDKNSPKYSMHYY